MRTDSRGVVAAGQAQEYNGGMKLKTSVTLSEDIVKNIDRVSRKGESRSETIERLLRAGLAARARHAVDARDLALINRHADELNAEADDVLIYQGDV
jgi:metal-responsive CopG/Arc/MetJ family transcriptional regulator